MEGFKPRRLKIVDQGLCNYTGIFGVTEFVDGVSTHPVAWQEAQRLGANVLVVDADNEDHQIGPSCDYDRARDLSSDAAEVKSIDTGTVVDGEVVSNVARFTRAELEKIADEKGLAGVRAIANARNRTGRSIEQCIIAVLDAQGDNPTQSTIAGPGEA